MNFAIQVATSEAVIIVTVVAVAAVAVFALIKRS